MLSMGSEASASLLKGKRGARRYWMVMEVCRLSARSKGCMVLEGYDLESFGPIWKVSREFDWFSGLLKVSS